MRFWCSTIEVPWTWGWRAYPGVWLIALTIAVPYFVAVRRRAHLAGGLAGLISLNNLSGQAGLAGQTGPAGPVNQARQATKPTTNKQIWCFTAGVLAFWLASDWPLGLLGSSYLASAHMMQFLLYTLAAAPLLMLGTPEWMARQVTSRLKLYRLLQRISRPIFAGVTFNLVLIATHSPWTVDVLRTSQIGSFIMDMIWLTSGLLVWLPLLSPLQEHRMRSYPTKMVYLFTALGVVPAVPAGFLTFAGFPLYSIYELAPRFHGLSATTDQQMAGLIMKLGGIPIVWGMILVMMFRWSDESRAQGEADRAAARAKEQLGSQSETQSTT